MDNRINIWNELQEISPSVAAITARNPYQVPAGYFEGLPAQMLQLVQEDAESKVLATARNNPYKAPQGYFEGLPDRMLQLVQPEAVISIPAQAKNNPYNIPAGYFDTLPALLLNRLKAEEASTPAEELETLSPLLGSIGKKMPFSTPAGFFTELSDNAVAGARAIEFVNEELENLSPLMRSLQPAQTYTVPAGYFDQLPQQVLSKLQQQAPAKVVSFNFVRKVVRYAAAAVVTGLLVTAGWLYTGTETTEIKSPEGTTPSIAVAGIQDSLGNMNDEALLNYLENQESALQESGAVASNDIKAANVQDMLGDVSDEELQQYLEQSGTVNNNNN